MANDGKLFIGFSAEDGTVISVPQSVLARHIAVLGSSGSGKTYFCKAVVEECVRNRIPVIAVDPQGDLASLGLVGDRKEAGRRGVGSAVADDYFSKLDLKVWTPGSTSGIPVSLSPSVEFHSELGYEEKIRAFGGIASSIAALAGYDVNSDAGQAACAAFSAILEYADKNRLAVDDLRDVIMFLTDPPVPLRRAMDPLFSQRDRAMAAKKLAIRLSGANRLLFDLGYPIDVDVLLGYEVGGAYDQGKTRVSVIYLNTLQTQEEKEMFVASLANALYARMLQSPCKDVQAMFYLDEAAPYLPPSNRKTPASKAALMMLLRQARKYGVGCMVATQSPGDLDYTALAQTGTWVLGRISTGQEAAKVYPALAGQPRERAEEIVCKLPSMQKGRFVLSCPDCFSEPTEIDGRFLVSDHKTLDTDKVNSITTSSDRARFGGVQAGMMRY